MRKPKSNFAKEKYEQKIAEVFDGTVVSNDDMDAGEIAGQRFAEKVNQMFPEYFNGKNEDFKNGFKNGFRKHLII